MTTLILGLIAGGALVVAFVVVLLECTYDAGFREGIEYGRREALARSSRYWIQPGKEVK